MNTKLPLHFSDEDWFSLGKLDAWAGRSKLPPEQDPQAASLYDLGYSEGSIERSPKTSFTLSAKE